MSSSEKKEDQKEEQKEETKQEKKQEKKDSATIPFEILVEKSDLVRELSLAQGILERKTTIPILTNFLFETSGSKILITGSDLDLSLRTFCPATVKTQGSCTVPGKKLYDYVKLLPDGEIRIKTLPNDWIEIRSGRSHTKMVALHRARFPNLPNFPSDAAVRLPAGLLRTIIHKTQFAVSTEEAKYVINGSLLIVQTESITMVATDGHRLAHIQAKVAVAPESEIRVLIPKKALSELHSLLSHDEAEFVEMARDESHLFFRVGSRILIARQLSGSFPNYEAVLPKEFPHSLSLSTVELSRGIQRVSQFADIRSSAVRLKIGKEELKLSSSCAESGESEETLETAYSSNALTIAFNSRYLLDFTRVTSTDKLTFQFKGPDDAAEMNPEENAESYTFRYVVMPVRI